MKFLTFIIMIVTLESLCLFFFKQTFSMISMSIITVCGFLCFTAKNWKTYNKVIKKGVVGIFCFGIMLIFLKEHLNITPQSTDSVTDELYVLSITFCFILLVMAVFFIKFNANNISRFFLIYRLFIGDYSILSGFDVVPKIGFLCPYCFCIFAGIGFCRFK